MATITLKNIRKVYAGNVVAVERLDLEVRDKEFLVLVGPSGCGKSTTLRMIAGLEDITDGELQIDGKLMNRVHPKDRDIAMVFQNYALYPHMTVYKNMAFGLELRKVPKQEIREKVTEAARILKIDHLLERKPKALSGGQRQRVALGRAMVRNPKVFLLDEPLSNLDAKLRTEMRTEIAKLHKKIGTTFIYVTHDQMEAMTMGDRIVVMKDGVVHQVDTPQRLYNYPCNTFVAGFIGSPQMNFAEVIVEAGERILLRLEDAALPVSTERYPPEVLRPYDGKKLLLGIRVEDISDRSTAGEGILATKVELTELMGSEVYAYLNYKGVRFTAKLPTDTKARIGADLPVAIHLDKIHLFDAETGLALNI